ncbi:asparagine synthase [Romboutsia sp.]|uniref:asparagine synthase n=1 Tax=Romboutsia sp. TaxID=1965302 RepID=UPI002C6A91EA|nr:asparagine synthase [Romboutsia sp.]HSQ88612.1 asparagine synthase [Romboutsia sp.]
MKKGIIPVTLGTAVTMAGLAVDVRQSKRRNFNKRDYNNMTGALLVGAGVAHIALGTIGMIKE